MHLSPQNAQFLEAIVAGGLYPSVDAAIDAAVAALREKTEQIPFVDDEHMAAVNEGLAEADAGLAKPMTDEDWSRLHEEVNEVRRRSGNERGGM